MGPITQELHCGSQLQARGLPEPISQRYLDLLLLRDRREEVVEGLVE